MGTDDKGNSPELLELIRGCARQERSAQRKLYERFSSAMYAVCVRYVGNRENAKDVLQEGFLVVFDKIGTFKGEGSFEGWMRKIFINASLMYIRRNDALKFSEEIETVPVFEMGLDTYSAIEQMNAKQIMSLVGEMPAGFRSVFNLYVIEGYSHCEIAAMLGITEGSSRSQLSRGKNWLQERLKQYI